jgi:hypothetical protein
MALDKQFLKYKLEKIKNDKIWKDQDSETKQRIRKENAKLAAEEADAIHSYLTGEDNIDALDNKSFLENRIPGNLFLTPKKTSRGKKEYWQGELNVRQVQTDPKIKKTRLSRILKRFRTIAKSNIDSAKQMVIFKKIFDKLNITFGSDEIKIDGNINARSIDVREEINLKGNESIDGDLSVEGDIHLRESSATQNGYTYLPNGILIQWGISEIDADGDRSIAFPKSFPRNCFSVAVNHKLSGGWNSSTKYGYPITAKSYDKNGFVINRNDTASDTINLNYIAIGN